MHSARVVANAVSGNETVKPAYLLSEKDALCRVQFDFVFSAQREEWPKGLKKLLQSWRVKEDFVQPDDGVCKPIGG